MTGPAPVGEEASAGLAALHALCFDRPWGVSEIEGLLTSPGVAALAVQGGAAFDGFVMVRAMAGEAEILTLCVNPARRRAGLGRLLVEAGAGACAGVGAEVLWLEVAADNTGALAMYAKAGFEVAGRRPGYYSRGPGAPSMDAVLMRRDLNSGEG